MLPEKICIVSRQAGAFPLLGRDGVGYVRPYPVWVEDVELHLDRSFSSSTEPVHLPAIRKHTVMYVYNRFLVTVSSDHGLFPCRGKYS